MEGAMRTTVNLDEELLEEAIRVTGLAGRTAVIHEGLRALVSRESARRLARLGGSEQQLRRIRRRRSR
jgi:Arc/MetJ family transcription regulator